ncbi:CRISPR-associated endonuclease Cas3'' [Natrialbaceae archaeon A-arb3/5]
MSDLSVPPILARPRTTAEFEPNELEPHLRDVRERALELLPDCSEELTTVVAVCAYLHDFGKLNGFFQRYIHARDRDDDSVSISAKKRSHGYLGALACQHVLRQYGLSDHWQAVGFFAVAKHHATSLTDFRKVREYMGEVEFGPFTSVLPTKQLETIIANETLRNAAGEMLATARPDNVSPSAAFKAFASDFQQKDTVTALADYRPTRSGSEEYVHLLRVWSTLTCADKLSSAGLPNRSPEPLDPEHIPNHIEGFPEQDGIRKTLNSHRETARKTCVQRVDDFLESEKKLARITLPTGFGKTLTGTQTALELAQIKGGRVIYALPYTSIIDQTDDLFQDVFDLSPLEERYTIHHYLAETRTQPGALPDRDAPSYRDQQLLAETWQSDLILTTFVQLFESLTSPTNKQSLKLPALQNSVILIDEPQALSHSWWRLISHLCRLLCDHYNIHVIFMTATQPGLFQYDEQVSTPFEFLPDATPYYNLIENTPRVNFYLHESVQEYLENPRSAAGYSIPAAAADITAETTGSTLAICNTIQSTIELSSQTASHFDAVVNLNAVLKQIAQTRLFRPSEYGAIVDELVDRARGEVALSTLTTRLRPIDRKLLLSAIERLTDCEQTSLYVISTQLIEAGVDVSFDRLYRDIAPVPSIVQAAGRCNREFGSETSTVTVWRLASSAATGYLPSQQIYTGTYNLLYPTREALKSQESSVGGVISEATMIDEIVDRYYERLHSLASPGDHDLVRAVENAQFGSLSNESLISDDYPTIDVVVCVDAIDLKLVRMYKQTLREGYHDWSTALQRHLSSRTISLPLRDTDVSVQIFNPITDDEYYYVDATEIPSRYTLETASGLCVEGIPDQTSF